MDPSTDITKAHAYGHAHLTLKTPGHPRLYVTPQTRTSLYDWRTSPPHDAIWETIVEDADRFAQQSLPDEPANFPKPQTFHYGGSFDGEILAGISRACRSQVRPALLSNGFLHALSGETRYAAATIRWLLHVAAWDVEGATGVFGNDIEAAMVAMAMACAYDWVYEAMSPSQRHVVKRALTDRARQICSFLTPLTPIYNGEYCNHSWMDAGAVILCGIALFEEVPDAPKWIDRMVHLFRDNFFRAGEVDGSWHEGAFYWKTAVFCGVYPYADALRACFGIDLYDHPWLKHGGEYALAALCQKPELRLFFGDGYRKFDWEEFLALEKWATEYDRPEGRWPYAPFRNDPAMWRGYPFSYLWLDKQSRITEPTTDPCRQFANGDVFLRSNWSEDAVMLACHAGPYVGHMGYSHCHGDQNGLLLNAFGDRLLSNAGTYDGWGTRHHHGYYTQTLAHNNILVGGRGQAAMTPQCNGKIVQFQRHDDTIIVTGQTSEAYGDGVCFRRTITIHQWRDIEILDEVDLLAPAPISWLFHSPWPIRQDERSGIAIEADHALLYITLHEPEPTSFTVDDAVAIPPAGNLAPQFHGRFELPAAGKFQVRVRMRLVDRRV